MRTIIKEKRMAKGLTVAAIAKVVGKNPTFVAAALNGNHKLWPNRVGRGQKWARCSNSTPETTSALSSFPVRTDYPITTDPFKYRLLEIIGVYGDSMREQANEMFGDGIMSAIDFTIDMEKVTGSQGRRDARSP
ncbi:MAG: cyanate hydratase [Nitrospiraceae bacterium]